MNYQARVAGTAAFTLTLAGFYAPLFMLGPLFAPLYNPRAQIDETMNCPQTDLAIDRADTRRWLIRDEGGKLATRSEQRWSSDAYSVHFRLNAADDLIGGLLEFKRAHACPPRATALRGMDDLALLRQLESVQAQLDAGSGEEVELLKERTRLLDGLRMVPTPQAVPSVEINWDR